MALADYFARNALAASQVLAGFDEARIRTALSDLQIGVAIGTDAAERGEGLAIVDLVVRLAARLYPVIVVRGADRSASAVEHAMRLAREINPNIEFGSSPSVEIAVGSGVPASGESPRIFVGSDGWNAFVGTEKPFAIGTTDNPFGAGAAACLAAANLFRFVFQRDRSLLDRNAEFSVLAGEPRRSAPVVLPQFVGDVVLVGAGAIGNGAAWALSRLETKGCLHLIDHQQIDLGNLQRYVLASRNDENAKKVDVLSRFFKNGMEAKPSESKFDAFVELNGYEWPRMLLALDSATDRRAAQASLPQWISNAWTQPGDLGVSTHDFLNAACVSCLYLVGQALENEDSIVASALGISDHLMEVRILLHTGQGTPRELLESIAVARNLPIDRLQPFEGRPIRDLYVEGFCGGAVIPIGAASAPREEVHVPLAHQSAFAGVLLGAAAVREALGLNPTGTHAIRIDVMKPLGAYLSQPFAKDERGICICQDRDYRVVYQEKYAPSRSHGELARESSEGWSMASQT